MQQSWRFWIWIRRNKQQQYGFILYTLPILLKPFCTGAHICSSSWFRLFGVSGSSMQPAVMCNGGIWVIVNHINQGCLQVWQHSSKGLDSSAETIWWDDFISLFWVYMCKSPFHSAYHPLLLQLFRDHVRTFCTQWNTSSAATVSKCTCCKM